MPGVDDNIIFSLQDRTSVVTDIGRARVFLRISLNTASLATYLTALTCNISILNKCYETWAIVPSKEFPSAIGAIENLLSTVAFDLIRCPAKIEEENYWSFV
eukprot:TRINITY_DN6362_c0_g3_i3.p1 TRINITY_DN6362_c0_g3~~TRINITY_DN6362_c0_g3_i3.p1  ORF type:complete len:102 (+),score=7.96 TRINITY_DN6362_c0_g3_i3:157-462(+)